MLKGVQSHEGGKGQRFCGEIDAVDESNFFSMVERAKLDGRVDLCVEVQTAERRTSMVRDTGTAWIVMDLIGAVAEGLQLM